MVIRLPVDHTSHTRHGKFVLSRQSQSGNGMASLRPAQDGRQFAV